MKGGLVIRLGAKPSDSEDDMPEEEDGEGIQSEALQGAAEEMLAAIKSGDAKALATALSAAIHCC